MLLFLLLLLLQVQRPRILSLCDLVTTDHLSGLTDRAHPRFGHLCFILDRGRTANAQVQRLLVWCFTPMGSLRFRWTEQ
jgi:hypothetical protein